MLTQLYSDLSNRLIFFRVGNYHFETIYGWNILQCSGVEISMDYKLE